jgi:hypothetical protein
MSLLDKTFLKLHTNHKTIVIMMPYPDKKAITMNCYGFMTSTYIFKQKEILQFSLSPAYYEFQ